MKLTLLFYYEKGKGLFQLAARFLASERRKEPDLRFPSLARSEGIGFHL
jgi:hypothetical protein